MSPRVRVSFAAVVLAGCFGGEANRDAHPATPGGVDGGAVDAPAPPPAGREACAAYIECTSQTFPAGLDPVMAAYAPDGSCWASLDESTCIQACLAGLRQAHAAGASTDLCPACYTDAECSGSEDGPACNRARHTCVPCTSDAHCGGSTPACDIAAPRCVACTADVHCGRSAPVCDPAARRCVACMSNTDCAAGVCNAALKRCEECVSDSDCPSDSPRCLRESGSAHCVECKADSDCPNGACQGGSCCQARSCEELQGAFGGKPLCGTSWDWLGSCPAYVNCGPCARGTCENLLVANVCSLEGEPCTPHTAGACLTGEVCAYVPSSAGHFCALDRDGSECVYGEDSYQCGDYAFSCVGATTYSPGACRVFCRDDADCGTGAHCSATSELAYGVCT